MSISETGTLLRDAAGALASAANAEATGDIVDRELQALFAGVLRVYAAKHAGNPDLAPFLGSGGVTATDVAVAATGMLDAAGMAVFELGMWQTIKGRG